MKNRRGTTILAVAGLAMGALLATTAGYANRQGAKQPSQPKADPAPSCCRQAADKDKAPDSCPMVREDCPKTPENCPEAKSQPAQPQPAAKVSSAVTDGGFQPSAFPNVNVRFRPASSAAPRPSASSIYMRPGTDKTEVRRSRPAVAADMAPRQAQPMPDGSFRLIADPSEMTYAIARMQPSGRPVVGCSANDGHGHDGKEKSTSTEKGGKR